MELSHIYLAVQWGQISVKVGFQFQFYDDMCTWYFINLVNIKSKIKCDFKKATGPNCAIGS